jgi:hypothetical protein
MPVVTTENVKLVLYADDTIFIITNPSPIEFVNDLIKFLLRLMNGLGIIYYP